MESGLRRELATEPGGKDARNRMELGEPYGSGAWLMERSRAAGSADGGAVTSTGNPGGGTGGPVRPEAGKPAKGRSGPQGPRRAHARTAEEERLDGTGRPSAGCGAFCETGPVRRGPTGTKLGS
eukprot:10230445-Heterocapsa_arctica.AAC.1